MGSPGENLVGVLRRGRQEAVVDAQYFAFKKDLQGHAEAKPSLYHEGDKALTNPGTVCGLASMSTVNPCSRAVADVIGPIEAIFTPSRDCPPAAATKFLT